MDNREIKDSFNNSTMEHINIQSDIVEKHGITMEDLEALKKAIEIHSVDKTTQEQNREFFEKFQESLKENNKVEANKYLRWIEKGLNNAAAVLTIATSLGI